MNSKVFNYCVRSNTLLARGKSYMLVRWGTSFTFRALRIMPLLLDGSTKSFAGLHVAQSRPRCPTSRLPSRRDAMCFNEISCNWWQLPSCPGTRGRCGSDLKAHKVSLSGCPIDSQPDRLLWQLAWNIRLERRAAASIKRRKKRSPTPGHLHRLASQTKAGCPCEAASYANSAQTNYAS